MEDDKDTTILLKTSTKKRLTDIGKMDESYDRLVNRILDVFEECKIEETLENKER